MRKSVLWNVSRVRLPLVMLLALVASLAVSGCGGGGGSTTTGGGTTVPVGNPKLATITGVVTDTTTTAAPIKGALITVSGTSLSAKTTADGKFSIVNVPLGTVGLIVTSPDVNSYQGSVLYGAPGQQKIYNDPSKCPIPAGAQASSIGTSPLPYPLQLYPAGTNPPAPPYTGAVNANGCPL